MQDFILNFQIDKYEVDDTDTVNQVNHFQKYYCKGGKLCEFSILLKNLLK